jgi:hypothetical protein
MTIPTPPWHQDVNIDFLSLSVYFRWSTLLGLAVWPNRLAGAMYRRFFDELFKSTLGTCASSATKTHVVQAWWGTTSFSPHCQTAPEPDFSWTADMARRPGQLASTIPDTYRLRLIQRRSMTCRYYSNRWRLPAMRLDWNQEFRQTAHLCATKSWKLCWNAWEQHGTSSAEIWFLDKCWLAIFAQLFEYHTLLKPVTNFDHSAYT